VDDVTLKLAELGVSVKPMFQSGRILVPTTGI